MEKARWSESYPNLQGESRRALDATADGLCPVGWRRVEHLDAITMGMQSTGSVTFLACLLPLRWTLLHIAYVVTGDPLTHYAIDGKKPFTLASGQFIVHDVARQRLNVASDGTANELIAHMHFVRANVPFPRLFLWILDTFPRQRHVGPILRLLLRWRGDGLPQNFKRK